ncbi:MAG TPA: MBL fold metallo-hydrolase [Gaiellaceae bacterium]|nr:MBL fold metallo-hydrolase [Gaiellaceae bacterium]
MAEPIVQKLNDNVVRCGTWVVNWYLVAADDGVTVIDAAVTKYRPQLEPGLAALGRTTGDVKAVVLTHCHNDHIGFAEELRNELSIPVYIHELDAEPLTTGESSGKTDGSMLPYLRHPAIYRGLYALASGGGMKAAPVREVTTYADGEELPVPGRPRVVFTPGHSDGHSALLAAGVLFAGDALCTLNVLTGKRGPQVMPRPFNRSTAQALASLDRLVDSGASLLAPGHGDPVSDPNAAIAEAKNRGAT